jgi:aminopeptidase-like protein
MKDLTRSPEDARNKGEALFALVKRLYPICRSITGNGVRETLQVIKEIIPIEIREVPSGAAVLDWNVPNEWNIRDAWIKGPDGRKIVDFQQSNLHIVSYSIPFRDTLSLAELKKHLFSLPDHPDWVPYRTSYYKETWGFCLAHRRLASLPEGEYEVCVDSTLTPGSLTYGELLLPGLCADEVLISCHVCHPSMANDNLSGIAVATFLASQLAQRNRRYSYRFIFIPGTIGSITWLALNEHNVKNTRLGLTLAGVGDTGAFHYKKTRNGDAYIDRLMLRVLRQTGRAHQVLDFEPYGYDERQFESPGFNLPVGCLMRTPFGQYPEYHSSADDLRLVKPESLADTLDLLEQLAGTLEGETRYLNLNPRGEPQLGRRGLYETLGGFSQSKQRQMAMLWLLNFSDGDHSFEDIADRSKLPAEELWEVARVLEKKGLLKQLASRG